MTRIVLGVSQYISSNLLTQGKPSRKQRLCVYQVQASLFLYLPYHGGKPCWEIHSVCQPQTQLWPVAVQQAPQCYSDTSCAASRNPFLPWVKEPSATAVSPGNSMTS